MAAVNVAGGVFDLAAVDGIRGRLHHLAFLLLDGLAALHQVGLHVAVCGHTP